MKKIAAFALAVLLVFSLAGCSGDKEKEPAAEKYTPSYHASGMVHSSNARSVSMTFKTFDGLMVYKLDNSSGAGKVRATGTIESGKATVSYDEGDGKIAFMTLDAETLSSEKVLGEDTQLKSGTIYILVEAPEECANGEFKFTVE